MKITKVKAVYYSATGNAKKVVEAIAGAMAKELEDVYKRQSQPRKSQAAHGEETAQAPAKQLADAGDDGL